MTSASSTAGRRVASSHGLRRTPAHPEHETALAAALAAYGPAELRSLYDRFAHGEDDFDRMMRRVIVAAGAKACGPGLRVESGVRFRNLETFAVGADVFIGTGAILYGRHDGTAEIGDHAWVGPQCFLDARDLVIGAYAGLGPGVRVLGSEHTGETLTVPIIDTDLIVAPVRIGEWTDIGTGAVILPGVSIGKGAIVGAGAVVIRDVAPFAVVAGVPAQFKRWRTNEGQRPEPEELMP